MKKEVIQAILQAAIETGFLIKVIMILAGDPQSMSLATDWIQTQTKK